MSLVRASGCLVYRHAAGSGAAGSVAAGSGAAGSVTAGDRAADGYEVLVVHRPRYDDWSFPKGKLDPGETDEECAVRELAEETGLVATLGAELPSAEYTDHKGRPKIVRYWMVEMPADQPDPAAGFEANDEVDELAWMDEATAFRHLSYHHDQELLRSLGSIVEP